MMTRAFWLTVGLITTGLALIGVVLPLVPTVPFLLLSAFAFAKSSPRLHAWLMGHKSFGPMIQDWQKHGRIRRRAKLAATVTVGLAFGLSVVMVLPWHILAIQAVTLSCVMIFIWSRPD